MVTDEQVMQYRREGYTCCDQVLDAATMSSLSVWVDRYIADRPALRPEHLDKPHVEDRSLLRYCGHPDLLDAVEAFIGPNIVLFSTHLISKAAGDGLAVPWHQDANYWPLEPMEVITLWLAIDPSDEDNGCMRVIPGTHTLGPIDHVQDEHPETKVLHERLPDDRIDEGKAICCVLPRGGASFHAPYLSHGSLPNTSGRSRCGLTMRFMPASTRMQRDGEFARWFADHPLFLLRGTDAEGVNTYAD